MLKKYITDNKSQFEREEPVQGHEQRFQARLYEMNSIKKRRYRMRFEYTAVASVIIFFGLIIIYQNKHTSGTELSPRQAALESEFAEAGYYYESEINARYNELIENCLQNNKSLISDIENDFEMLNSDYEKLQQEYAVNPHDERLKSAIITVYQQKLEILNLIIKKTCNVY